MTPTEHLGAADLKSREGARPPRARESFSSRFKDILPWAGGILLALLAVGIYLMAHARFGSGGTEESSRIVPGAGSIQVQVLNAGGNARLAQRLTDYLRSRGFDVVEIGNAAPSERTIIVDRSGRPGAASRVARAVGLADARTRQQIDRRLMLDVTVLLGRDAVTLAFVQEQSWRKNR